MLLLLIVSLLPSPLVPLSMSQKGSIRVLVHLFVYFCRWVPVHAAFIRPVFLIIYCRFLMRIKMFSFNCRWQSMGKEKTLASVIQQRHSSGRLYVSCSGTPTVTWPCSIFSKNIFKEILLLFLIYALVLICLVSRVKIDLNRSQSMGILSLYFQRIIRTLCLSLCI